MAKTMTYMIAHGASVVIVRDGERVRIPAGGGADFTDAEILSINKAAPGALRNPVNEGRGKAAAAASEEASDDGKAETPKAETAAEKKKRLAAEKKAAEEANKSDGSADDDDDDEDI